MCLCYLFSAKTARQLVNRKADFFTKRIDSHNESNRIANWNALLKSTKHVVKTFDMAIRHTRQTTRTELRVFSVAGFIFTYVQKYSME